MEEGEQRRVISKRIQLRERERSRAREGVRMDWYDPNYANGHFDIQAREASLAH